jgi:hypothetical protein
MTVLETKSARKTNPAEVLTKAVLRAADDLGLAGRALSAVLGVSEATLSRMRKGAYILESGSKPFELSVLFVRLYRSLDAMAGGEAETAQSWLNAANAALGGRPVDKIQTIAGLFDVIAHLDAARARV